MKKILLSTIVYVIALIVFTFLGMYSPHGALAQSSSANAATNSASNVPSGGGGSVAFENPLNATNLPQFIIQATKILLLLVGMIVVVVIIYGGFVLVTSQGSPDGIKRGKAIITWAIVGLLVSLLAFSIVSILQNLLGK